MNKVGFFVTNSLRGIVRNRKRYILFGVILFAVASVVVGSFILSLASRDFVEQEKGRIGDISMADEETRAYYFSVVQPADNISAFSNIFILAFSFLGIVTLVFLTMLLLNERVYEVGILYALGMSKTYIYLSLLLETAVFVLSVVVAGILTASGILYLLFSIEALPDVRAYMMTDNSFFVGIITISLVLVAIPSVILLTKIARSSPVKLLK